MKESDPVRLFSKIFLLGLLIVCPAFAQGAEFNWSPPTEPAPAASANPAYVPPFVPSAAPAPVPTTLSFTAPARMPDMSDNWLIAVGINRFNDSNVSPLRFCVNDAQALHDFFVQRGLVVSQQAYLLTTDAANRQLRPTRINILKAIKYACDNASPSSTIILSFSSHGFVEGSVSYLFPEDGDVGLLSAAAISVSDVNQMLRESKSKRKLVIVDACRNSPTREGRSLSRTVNLSGKFYDAFQAGEGQITLAACGPGQISWEMEETGHGAFTYFLLEGLRGKAQPDPNGLINVASLQAYLAQELPGWCKRKMRQIQQPWLSGEMASPIVLSSVATSPIVPPASLSPSIPLGSFVPTSPFLSTAVSGSTPAVGTGSLSSTFRVGTPIPYPLTPTPSGSILLKPENPVQSIEEWMANRRRATPSTAASLLSQSFSTSTLQWMVTPSSSPKPSPAIGRIRF